MTVITRKRTSHFAIIPNAVAEDERLRFEARGVLCYLLAKPHDWKVRPADLQRSGNIGRDKVYRILNELIKAGYLVREPLRDDKARITQYDYIVSDTAVPPPLPETLSTGDADLLPEKAETGPDLLPEKLFPEKLFPENTDAIIRTDLQPRTKNLPNERASAREEGFSFFWEKWDPLHRPENRHYCLILWNKLNDDQQRSAVQTIAAYIKLCALRSKPPRMVNYLRDRIFAELDGGPVVDRDGDFRITPDREEWSEWLGHFRRVGGEAAVKSIVKLGYCAVKTRWPAVVSTLAAG